MKRSEEQPQNSKWQKFLQALRGKRHGSQAQANAEPYAVTIMPRMICCLEQTLYLNLPTDFACEKNTKTECVFRQRRTGLLVNVSVMQTKLSLQKLRESDFKPVLAAALIPSALRRRRRLVIRECIRGFVKHSPTLRLCYGLADKNGEETFALYLMQWSSRLYVMSFAGINKNNAHLIEPICASVSLKHHHKQTESP